MDDLIRRVKSVAEKAASREEILPFLSVCVMNMHLSLLNLLFISFFVIKSSKLQMIVCIFDKNRHFSNKSLE